jgi:hypothetical protein
LYRIITLLAARDVQVLALVACIVQDHTKKAQVPPQPETSIARSPEQDYFTLPRHTPRPTPAHLTPIRKRSSITAVDRGGSNWSQILNPSSLSIRTPNKSSFDIGPHVVTTPLGTSYEASPTPEFSLPVPIRRQSPRVRLEGRNRPSLTQLQSQSPPQRQSTVSLTPTGRSFSKSGSSYAPGSSGLQKTLGQSSDRPKSGMMERSLTSQGEKHKVSFGGQSPLKRNASRATAWSASASTPGVSEYKKARTCTARIEIPQDDV